MKRTLIFIFILSLSIFACNDKNRSQRTIWVFDQENVLTDDQEKVLNEIITNFEKKTTNEIAIVTTNNIGEHEKMILYAMEFGKRHGIGKKHKNNGLVIVFSATLKETFIAPGLSTENILKDEICKRIVDKQMIPEFREGNNFEGLKNGLEECIRIWKEKK